MLFVYYTPETQDEAHKLQDVAGKAGIEVTTFPAFVLEAWGPEDLRVDYPDIPEDLELLVSRMLDAQGWSKQKLMLWLGNPEASISNVFFVSISINCGNYLPCLAIICHRVLKRRHNWSLREKV